MRKVAIFMGSKSDLPVIEKGLPTLDGYGIPYSVRVASAHRTPDLLHRLLEDALKDGVEVFIAAAGGAAHLAGVIASAVTKPVIGIPVHSKLDGLDSLLSTVQMPKGVPVATVAVDGAENACHLAAQILATSDKALEGKIRAKRKQSAEEIEAQSTIKA